MTQNKSSPRLSSALNEFASYLNPHYLNARSTLVTSLGFMGTFLERWLPTSLRSAKIEDIFNYLPLSDTLATSGQPTELQLASIEKAGFRTVINLAPHGLENSLKNEAELITRLGMKYIHIPVDFKNPTDENFAAFCAVLKQVGNEKTFVHCAANMRVSAFMYRYRTQILKQDPSTAQTDLHKIWKPFEAWEDFIQKPV